MAAAGVWLAGWLAAPPAPAVTLAEAPPELVRYGFDEDVDTGPDTLRVFQNARGSVRLSPAFRLGGSRSVEIRDVAHDGDFPELLGRFPLRREGRLFAHFGLLVTDPDQAFNVALAGPERFRLAKDGIGFWLQGRSGSLYHVSDSIPKRLMPLRAFVWYVFDLTYDVEAGTYDLAIAEEGARAPVVSRTAQPNATAQPGSAVEVFSLIGDTGDDESDAVYYVDDILLAADRPIDLTPFVAPGRRKLFVDDWSEQRRRGAAGLGCFAAADPGDLGLAARDLAGPERDAATDLLRAALDPSGPQRAPHAARELPAPLAAVALWTRGCEALRQARLEESHAAFERAEALWPRGRIYPLSRALALARAGRADEAERLLDSIGSLFRGDLRVEVARARIALARDDLDRALEILAPAAEGLPVELGHDVGRLAEQYFLVLLWKGSYDEALRFASTAESRLREMSLPTAPWSERVGDAAFFLGDAARARDAYRAAVGSSHDGALLYAKLADTCVRLGDLEGERAWREKVYGSLSE